jgi:hypothetical protein
MRQRETDGPLYKIGPLCVCVTICADVKMNGDSDSALLSSPFHPSVFPFAPLKISGKIDVRDIGQQGDGLFFPPPVTCYRDDVDASAAGQCC